MQNTERRSPGTVGYFLSISGSFNRLSAAYLFWEWSASGVDNVCVVVFVFWSGRRPRGCRPGSVRGRSVPRRSGSKPSLFRFISEYGQLTWLQTRGKELKVSLQTQHIQAVSPHIKKCEIFMTHLFFFLYSESSNSTKKKKNPQRWCATLLTCSESHSEVL